MRRSSIWLLASVFGCLSAGCSLNPRGELPSAGEDSNDGVFQGEPGSAASPDEGTVAETPKANMPPPSAPSDGSDILVDEGDDVVPTSDSTSASGQDNTPVVQGGPSTLPDAGDAGVPDGGASGDGSAPEDSGASDRDGLGRDGGTTDAGDAGP